MTVLASELVDRALRAQPLPVANALVELEAALSVHEQRDRMVEVFRALVRTLGALALAGRIHAGPGPKQPSREGEERLARLRRQALTDGEWIGLCRELLRPWKAGGHPLPELVELLFAKGISDGVDELLGMRKRETVAHGSTGDEAQVRAIVEERAPRLAAMLEATLPLWESARIVTPIDPARAFSMHGPTPPRGRWRVVALAPEQDLAFGKAYAIDRDGRVLLDLEPAVVIDRASREVPEDLFFLDGRDRKAAVFTAFPSMAEIRRVDVLETLDRALAMHDTEAKSPLAGARPYRGLASFRAEDAALFVGRESLALELANRVAQNAWVTVTGASASGKTSLLAAGVVPALRARVEREREAAGYRGTDTPDYLVVTMRPGRDPMSALETALGPIELDAARILEWTAARRRVLVLIVDQAEELLTLCHDQAERERFGALLAALTPSDNAPVRVVLSLRVDFMAQLSTIESIGDRYQRATQVVSTPAKDDLLRILREPAERSGARWDDGVAEEIVARAADRPAALALVSFVADRLWDRRSEGVLTREAYEAIGGVEGALAEHADAVIAALTDAQRATVRTVMLRLVTAEGTRDVVPRAELEGADALLDALIDARLLSARERGDGEPTVELAHEALLEHWPALRAWRDEDKEGEIHLARLRAAAREWKARPERDLLWRGVLLAEHRAVAARRALSLNEHERAFIAASANAERRASRVRNGSIAAAGILLAAIGLFSAFQWQNAERAQRVAEQQSSDARAARRRAEARALVAEAGRHHLAGRPAEELALLRVLVSPDADAAERELAMNAGFMERSARSTARVLPFDATVLAVAGSHAIVARLENESLVTTGPVRVLDATTGQARTIDPDTDGGERGAVDLLSPTGRYAHARAWVGSSLRHRLVDVETGAIAADFGECEELSIAFSGDDREYVWTCASDADEGTISAGIFSSGRRITLPPCRAPIAWSDEHRLAAARCADVITIFDVDTGQEVRTLDPPPDRTIQSAPWEDILEIDGQVVTLVTRAGMEDWRFVWFLEEGSLAESRAVVPEAAEGGTTAGERAPMLTPSHVLIRPLANARFEGPRAGPWTISAMRLYPSGAFLTSSRGASWTVERIDPRNALVRDVDFNGATARELLYTWRSTEPRWQRPVAAEDRVYFWSASPAAPSIAGAPAAEHVTSAAFTADGLHLACKHLEPERLSWRAVDHMDAPSWTVPMGTCGASTIHASDDRIVLHGSDAICLFDTADGAARGVVTRAELEAAGVGTHVVFDDDLTRIAGYTSSELRILSFPDLEVLGSWPANEEERLRLIQFDGRALRWGGRCVCAQNEPDCCPAPPACARGWICAPDGARAASYDRDPLVIREHGADTEIPIDDAPFSTVAWTPDSNHVLVSTGALIDRYGTVIANPHCSTAVLSSDGSHVLARDCRGITGPIVYDVPPLADPSTRFLDTGASTNLRVCHDTYEVVPVVPYPEPSSVWAPREACAR